MVDVEKLTAREEEQDSWDTKPRSISDEALVENEAAFVPHALVDELIILETLFPDRDITLLDAFRNITDVVALIVGFDLWYEHWIWQRRELVPNQKEQSSCVSAEKNCQFPIFVVVRGGPGDLTTPSSVSQIDSPNRTRDSLA